MCVILLGLECKLIGMRQIEFLHKSKQKFSPLTPIIHICVSPGFVALSQGIVFHSTLILSLLNYFQLNVLEG